MTANAAHPVVILPNAGPGAERGDSPASAADRADARPDRQAPTSGGDTSALALTSFMLGIASVVFGWTFVAPITGLILGSIALRRRTNDRTLALWGVWLNGIMLALTALALLAMLALIGFGLIAIPFLAV